MAAVAGLAHLVKGEGIAAVPAHQIAAHHLIVGLGGTAAGLAGIVGQADRAACVLADDQLHGGLAGHVVHKADFIRQLIQADDQPVRRGGGRLFRALPAGGGAGCEQRQARISINESTYIVNRLTVKIM